MSSLADRVVSPGRQFAELKVPQTLYEMLVRDFPAIASNPAFRRLLGVILFSGFREPETGRVLVHHELVAWCESRDPYGRNYRSGNLLQRFSEQVFPLDDLGWSWQGGAARTVPVPVGVDRYQSLLLSEDEDWVSLGTGHRWHDRLERNNREYRRVAVADVERESFDHPAVRALGYLNGLSSRFFSLDGERLLTAQLLLDQETEAERYRHVLRCIGLLGSQSTLAPVYRPSRLGRTARVFSDHGLLQLPGDYRRVLFPNWVELDLSHAQLSIVSALWGLEGLQSVLKDGTPLWGVFLADLGLPEASKAMLKRSVYGLCYGMEVRNLWSKYGYLDEATGKKLVEHPLITELLAGRDRQLQMLLEAGGGYDCWGKWVPAQPETVRSALAEISQALELKLVLPAFELIAQPEYRDYFAVTLFQHDGFSVTLKHKDPQRLPLATKAFWSVLRKTVADTAAQYGCSVRLEERPGGASPVRLFL